MILQRIVFQITGTTPNAQGQAVVGSVLPGLEKYDWFQIDADLVGATGGTLDIYIQRKLASGVWLDWAHFTQLAAGASAIRYSFGSQAQSSITTVGKCADDGTGTPALAANSFVGGHPGDQIRVLAVAGAGTSVGASITVYVSAFKQVS